MVIRSPVLAKAACIIQQEMVRPQLHHRRPRGVVEPGIGLRDQALKLVVPEEPAQIGPHHPERDLLVGQPRQRRDFGLGHHRHGFGHVKPAVAGKPCHHRCAEAQNRRSATGRDVVHGTAFKPSGF
jgi:hypothetical protein